MKQFEHATRSVAMLLALWLGVGLTYLPLKWLGIYIASMWLIVTAVYWHREAQTGCSHGSNSDDCPDCRH